MIDGFINLRLSFVPMEKELSAGAIIFHGKKFLLLHYESGHWDFVKGKVEKKESYKETVSRECKEETGITDLEFVTGFEEKIHYFYTRKGKRISKTVVFLLAKTKTEKVKLSYEHIGFAWLPYKQALEKLTFENAKQMLKKAHAFL